MLPYLLLVFAFALPLQPSSQRTNSTPSGAAAPTAEFDWANNTYYPGSDYSGGTLFGLRKDSSLRKDDTVLLLGRVHSTDKKAKVLEIIDPAPARKMLEERVKERGFRAVFEDKNLWNQIGWVRTFNGDGEAVTVARLSAKGVFAIANLGENVIALQGPDLADSPYDVTPVIPQAEANAVLAKVKSSFETKSCMAANRLVTAVRYGPAQGHEVIELFVGNPVYLGRPVDKSTIDTIRVCRVFVVDGQLQRLLEVERSSSKEEHVDTAPPTLTRDSWWKDIDETLAYLSLDGGKTWQRASENSGFEGMNYRIDDVSTGRELFHAYHYIVH